MKNRFAAIDGLRGLAILMVTAFHLFRQTHFQPVFHGIPIAEIGVYGGYGVQLFFCLSGFCLFYPCVKKYLDGKPHLDVKSFFIRRAIRILPAWFISVLVFAYIWYRWRGPDHFWSIVFKHLTFTQIFYEKYAISMHGVTWSLATEFHFYLLFPLLAWLFLRSPHAMLLACLVESLLFRWLGTTYMPDMPKVMNFSILSQICNFGAGMYVAYLLGRYHRQLEAARRYQVYAALIGIGGLIALPYMIHYHIQEATPIPGWAWMPIYSLVWGALALLAVMAANPFRQFMGWKPVAYIGEISFSLYLYNVFMGCIPPIIAPGVPMGSGWWWVIAPAVVLAAGLLSFYLFEYPFFGLRERLREAKSSALPPPIPVGGG